MRTFSSPQRTNGLRRYSFVVFEIFGIVQVQTWFFVIKSGNAIFKRGLARVSTFMCDRNRPKGVMTGVKMIQKDSQKESYSTPQFQHHSCSAILSSYGKQQPPGNYGGCRGWEACLSIMREWDLNGTK